MQLPYIDRTAIRPAGTEVVAPAANRVIPVAPVNPAPAPHEPGASIVNEISATAQALSLQDSEKKSDPLKGGAQGDDSNKDWTKRDEASVRKPEAPPKEPLSKMLMDHIHSVWSASARVVEIWLQNNPGQNPTINQQVQAQNQAASRQTDPLAAPGKLAKEVLTYSPSKIRKLEKPE